MNYLICYLGAGNALILHSCIEAKSMGAAMMRAEEEKSRSGDHSRWFVLHGYEITNEDDESGEGISDEGK